MAGRAFILFLPIIFLGMAIPEPSYAHGGRTDANGCHKKTVRQENDTVTDRSKRHPRRKNAGWRCILSEMFRSSSRWRSPYQTRCAWIWRALGSGWRGLWV